MPWTKADVDSHKKGLSDSQKEKWAKIANAALASCIKDGGSDATCAPKAIRIANSKVSTNESYSIIANFQTGYKVEKKKRNNRDHIIVPVVMMVEGVHNGSHGEVLHPMDELGKIPESWNGIPIVINHPTQEGVPVSANDPDILEQVGVGNVFGTFVDGTKLKAKAWLDELKLQEISVDLYNKIMEGKELEVSLGVFTDDEEEEGEWRGEKYTRIAHNHRPDHLALLPECVGACSLVDGCGLGVNKEIQPSQETEEAGVEDNENSINLNVKEATKMEKKNPCPACLEKINALVTNKESGFDETDREWLDTLSEAQLDKVIPKVIEKTVEVEKKVEVEVNKLTPEDQAALAFGKKQLKERRERYIKGIQANAKDIWTDDKLKNLDDDMLESIYKSVVKEVEPELGDYSLLGAGMRPQIHEENDEPPLKMTGFGVKNEKK